MDAKEIGFRIFQIELETGNNIDDRAKYVATGSVIVVGLIANSLIAFESLSTIFLGFAFSGLLFFMSFFLSIVTIVGYNSTFLPNSIFNDSEFRKCFGSAVELESDLFIEILDTQCTNVHKLNIVKNKRLYFAFVFFVSGLFSALITIFSSFASIGFLLVYLSPVLIFMGYNLYKAYEDLPSENN